MNAKQLLGVFRKLDPKGAAAFEGDVMIREILEEMEWAEGDHLINAECVLMDNLEFAMQDAGIDSTANQQHKRETTMYLYKAARNNLGPAATTTELDVEAYRLFVGSRRSVADIGEELQDGMNDGCPGFLYTGLHWIEDKGEGVFYTLVGRTEFEGTLDACERFLWENFAKDECGGGEGVGA